MQRLPKIVALVVALTVGGLSQSFLPVLADSPYSLFLAECQRPKQQADAELVTKDGHLVTMLRVANNVTTYREYPVPAACGFALKTFSPFPPSRFDTLKTEVVFEFTDKVTTGESGVSMVFHYKGQIGSDKAVPFTAKPGAGFPFKNNGDGSFTGTISSAAILAKGIPANAEITNVALSYQPTIPKNTKRKIFVRSVKFLNEDASPNLKSGVGGCDLLGDSFNLFDFD